MLVLGVVVFIFALGASAVFDLKFSIALASTFFVLSPVALLAFFVARALAKIGYGGIIPITLIAVAFAQYARFAKNKLIPITTQLISEFIS